MASPQNVHRRLEHLEVALVPQCPTCQDRCVRSVVIALDIGTVISENRPDLCPLCGSRPTMTREIHLEDGE